MKLDVFRSDATDDGGNANISVIHFLGPKPHEYERYLAYCSVPGNRGRCAPRVFSGPNLFLLQRCHALRQDCYGYIQLWRQWLNKSHGSA